MKVRAIFASLVWAATMTGCSYTCIVQNTDPFDNPVVLTWSVDPTNQPNPGQLEAGFQAEFKFKSSTVSLNGYDPVVPTIEDDINLTFQSGTTRVIEWDGFEFIDRGNQRVPVSALAGLLRGQSTVVTVPSDPGQGGNPQKEAAAQRRSGKK
ncbi:MAG: hypothetical protein SH850_18355 [Planctomycetaceae bacterium]|nr:hypothetical protein [Planctomycetaceae bacterium]